MEQRTLGKSDKTLSILGFGGMMVTGSTPEEASQWVSEAYERGVTYFDVAPNYGNAQERLGPALKPYRSKCFLACKTTERGAEGARRDLEESFRLLETDHFDLYQLHGLGDVTTDVEAAFAPGGAMEVVLEAREQGRIGLIGFSAHTEEAAHAAMDRFDFDSLLMPMNFFTWTRGRFGASVHARAKEKGMGVLALKTMAYQKRPRAERSDPARAWPKCWYQPLTERDKISLALRFTLGLPVDAAVSPSHWELFQIALDIVESGEIAPIDEAELGPLKAMAEDAYVLFESASA